MPSSATTFSTTNTAAPARTLYLGYSNASWMGVPLPLDLALLGVPGCFVNVSLDTALVTGAPAPVPVPIPRDPVLVGATTYYQDLLFGDPSGKLLVTTRGAEMTLSGL